MSSGKPQSLTIIIPVYNERQTLLAVLKRIDAAPSLGLAKEIILVDDGSKDGTRELLQQLDASKYRVVLHERNQGKGAALHTGFKHATGDIVLVQDADLEYDPDDYPKLLRPFLEHDADVVYGSRFVGGESHRVLFFWHSVANRMLTYLSNMFTNLNLTDMEVCYKAFRREVIQSLDLREKRFGFEPEVTAKIAKIPKLRVYEVGVSYDGRTYEEGKKIGLKDAFRALWCIIKYH
ncbi:MAG TPA: glycosyltransferase family 2 protein [Candidatus Latescibacteria bacterium]|nr:glycosyltransferase family 2 protein [Candidatus Latescibacterota bacterium]HOS64079.1 glycosyltransferase family 2 protein [Candidatus Latescibacterota bacterium]